MMTIAKTTMAAAVLMFGLQLLSAQAPNAAPYSVITVEKMHCDSCAKRIARKIYEVPGVESVQVDVEKKLLWVNPKTGTQPSPRALWDAVEKANDRPTKLHTPTAVYTSKPQQ